MAGAGALDQNARQLNFISRIYFVSFVVTPFLIHFSAPEHFMCFVAILEIDIRV